MSTKESQQQRNTNDGNTGNDPFIFPLAANPSLGESEKNFKVYSSYLGQAFGNPAVRNIAVTGDYGIGKSSLIRWFESEHDACKEPSERRFRQQKQACEDGFLYISLGQYRDSSGCGDGKQDEAARHGDNADSTDDSVEDSADRNTGNNNDRSIAKDADDANNEKCENENTKDETAKDENDVNAVERRILLQIYARFHQKELPLTSFRMIDEPVKMRGIKSAIAGLFVFMVLLLAFHDQLGGLADAVGLLDAFEWKASFHLMLYLIVIIIASVAVGLLIYSCLPRIQLSALSIKHDNMELEMERKACESYLDQYSMELVYCMEQIAGKIRYTVVIEDMDRLDSDTCIEVWFYVKSR